MTRRTCTVCGKSAALYRCKYCGDTLCKEHLAPEMHWCVGLEAYKRDLEAPGTSTLPSESLPERKVFGRDKSSYEKKPWGIFAGNFSFLLLALISISFVLQSLVPAYTGHFKLVPALVTARPWTLITHIFLHKSFEHFFFNMLFFVFFGPVLERKIGSSKFLLIFFLSGIVAGLGWSFTTSNPLVAVVGASGALSGVFATLAVLMPRMKVYLFFFIPLEMWLTVILFALIDFALMGSGDMIAHTAHLSGLFFGLFAGLLLKGTTTRV